MLKGLGHENVIAIPLLARLFRDMQEITFLYIQKPYFRADYMWIQLFDDCLIIKRDDLYFILVVSVNDKLGALFNSLRFRLKDTRIFAQNFEIVGFRLTYL